MSTPSGAGIDMDASSLTNKRQLKRATTVETSGSGKRRRVSLKVTSHRDKLGVSSNREEESLYDKHLIANQGSQRLTGLSMKIGSRLGKLDHYGRFLKNLNQSGRISVGWNGTMKGDIDTRNVNMQIFRHRMSTDTANIVQANYPAVAVTGGQSLPTYLYPSNSLHVNSTENAYDLTNPATPLNTGMINKYPWQSAPAPFDVVQNAFIQHPIGTVSFAVLNRPDLEDMSWNLNKLKLKQESTPPVPVNNDLAGAPLFLLNGTGTDPLPTTIGDFNAASSISPSRIWTDVQPFKIDLHRRQSFLQQNNHWATPPSLLAASPTQVGQLAPYRYDAVLRYGKISYEFMNKNDTAATVQVIVYRVKKTSKLAATAATYTDLNPATILPTTTPSGQYSIQYPLNLLVSAVGQGYMNTVGDAYATENFQGRTPLYSDIYDNPAYPLLPVLRKTQESQNPFVEVMRNKFVMTAGSRRSLDLHLPGLAYDPADMPLLQGESGGSTVKPNNVIPSSQIPIVDQYSYAAVLSCNGQKMTRFFDRKPTSGSPGGSVTSFRTNNVPTTPTFCDRSQSMPDASPAWVPESSAQIFYVASPIGGAPFIFSVVLGLDQTAPTGFPDYTGVIDSGSTYTIVQAGTGFVTAGSLTARLNSLDGPVALVLDDVAFGPFSFHVNNLLVSSHVDAELPTELPMGDNHGDFHVDYAANYTEHIGACLYKDVHERNLYDCGQPVAPKLNTDFSSAPYSSTGSRMILPATSIVRQATRAIVGIGPDGANTTMSYDTSIHQASEV